MRDEFLEFISALIVVVRIATIVRPFAPSLALRWERHRHGNERFSLPPLSLALRDEFLSPFLQSRGYVGFVYELGRLRHEWNVHR